MFVSPQNSYFEALTPSVAVFENRDPKETIKLKKGHNGGDPDLIGSMYIKEGHQRVHSSFV